MIRSNLTASTEESEAGAVLTPLVDVVFMLVVFLLLTANAAPFALEVNTPTSEHAQAVSEPEPILIVTPDEDGAWRINDRRLHEADALEALRALVQAQPDSAVIITTEASASAQALIDALDLARNAGADRAEIAARPAQD